jgi:hypothetical protein
MEGAWNGQFDVILGNLIEFYLQCSVFEPGLNPPINFLFKMRKHISRVSRREKSDLLWLPV